VCEDIFKENKFTVKYDYLVVAAGNKTNTFDTPGIAEHEGSEVMFLKHLYHARQIRNRVLECFERASNPTISESERKRLLNFIVVGGGPTSCEFTSELHGFVTKDVAKWYPDLVPHISISLVEAGPGLLGSFDQALADYYKDNLIKNNINVRTGTGVTGVVDYQDDENHHGTVAHLSDGTTVPFGLMVWSAGLAPIKFVENSGLPLQRGGRIIVDEYLRVQGANGRVFALGDCAGLESGPLPPTASVAEQQGQYLAEAFNKYYCDFDVKKESRNTPLPLPGPITPGVMGFVEWLEFLDRWFLTPKPEFQYKSRGAMASMGWGSAVVDQTDSDLPFPKGTRMTGVAAMVVWRGGYFTKQLSWSNMMLIPMHWFKAFVFGRDISRF